MNQLHFLFVQVSKCCFREKCLCFTLNSGSISARTNQRESEKCELTFLKKTDKNLVLNVFVQGSILMITKVAF